VIAEQLTSMNGPFRRGPDAWKSRAARSLPVPLSPVMSAARTPLSASRMISARTCWVAREEPTISTPPFGGVAVSPAGVAASGKIFARIGSSSLKGNGLQR
jgi:hypothetical protein